jgi:hypothetical protein
MKISLDDLWRSHGTVDRGTYALVGAIGFALKHNLDRIIASYGFDRPWGLFNYWVPMRSIGRITELPRKDAMFLATMLVVALPFIWVGIVMTLRRLRSASLPSQLVILFFVPFVNLLFFVLLCLVPERGDLAPEHPSRGSMLARIVPDSPWGSAAFSLLFTVPVGLALVLLGARVLVTYGWGVFVALPFAMGFVAAVIYGIHQPRTQFGCVAVACAAVTILGLALLALAIEGVVCLAMAAPIAIPIAVFGASCGYHVQRQRWSHSGPPALASLFLLFVPGVQWFEHVHTASPPGSVVRSSLDIQAPPERVWKSVVAFSEIPPPTEWIFKAGIAYPVRAEILGHGPGAERHCVFSTGQFIEPIEIWDEPRQLKFSVTSNPAPMQEWTPYSLISPPHLHGFLVSSGGQFLLTPLANGGTRLEGTTWYRHGLWPAAYWRLWSDAIIHRIHIRVLEHIKHESELKTAYIRP